MIVLIVLLYFLPGQCVYAQFGDHKQNSGYVEVREGAHMFYWMFYTTAHVANYTERPLIVWLQGGPGGSSTGVGNFEILGPLDENLQERNYTWVNNFNVIFVDNPVGTGFSYVDDPKYLTTTNDQIALDFVELMRGFYKSNPEFENVPLYIYGQSYGGKMAVDMGIRMSEAEKAGTIRSNLSGIAMGNAWISPTDSTLTWGPLLLAAGLVDQAGYENIQLHAREAERLYKQELYLESTEQWRATQRAVNQATTRVDFYNILTKMPVSLAKDFDRSMDSQMMLPDILYRMSMTSRVVPDLHELMNTKVKEALRIPANVTWSSLSNIVFDTLQTDFMKPVTESSATPDWTLLMDTYEKQYKIPEDVGVSSSKPDLFLHSKHLKRVIIVELTVSWETNIPRDHTFKLNKYYELTNELYRNKFIVNLYTVEIGARVEKLLNETNIIITKYNGNLDLICSTTGQILWVDRLRWPEAEGYRNATRQPIWVEDRLEGYYKSYGNFRFFWINMAGHSVPRDNPAGSTAFLRDMTSFG